MFDKSGDVTIGTMTIRGGTGTVTVSGIAGFSQEAETVSLAIADLKNTLELLDNITEILVMSEEGSSKHIFS